MDRFRHADVAGRDSSLAGQRPIPRYSVGISGLGARHAREIGAAIHALEQPLKYTQTHFASEGHFIAGYNYPDLDARKRSRTKEEGFQRYLRWHCVAGPQTG